MVRKPITDNAIDFEINRGDQTSWHGLFLVCTLIDEILGKWRNSCR